MLKEQFLRMNKTRKRLFAGAMSLALISTSLNIGTFAVEAGSDKEGRYITAFEELPEDIRYQYLPIGAEEFEINFPDELNVTIYSEKEEEETDESAESEEEDKESEETEENSESTEDTKEPEDGNKDEDGSEESGSGEEETGSEESGSGEEETGSEESGTGEEGSGSEESGSGEEGSGSEESGSGEKGNGSEESGSGEKEGHSEESGTGEEGNGSEESGEGESGNGSEEKGPAEEGNDPEKSGNDSASGEESGSAEEGSSQENGGESGSSGEERASGDEKDSANNDNDGHSPEEGNGSGDGSGSEDRGTSEEGGSSASIIDGLFGPVKVYAGELRELSGGKEETLRGVVWKLNKDESQYARFQSVRAGDVFVYEPLIKAFGLKSDVELPEIRVTITEKDGTVDGEEAGIEDAPEEEEGEIPAEESYAADTEEPVESVTESEKEQVSENETEDSGEGDSKETESVSENTAEDSEEEGSVSENEAEEPAEDEETVSENRAEESVSENEVSENKISEAFDQMVISGGVRIRVEASEGVFPKGAGLKVKRLSDSDETKVKKVLSGQGEDDDEEEESGIPDGFETLSFDITIIDEEGNEIQPDLSFGTPEVTFENAGIIDDYVEEKEGDGSEEGGNDDGELSVYHFEDGLENAEKVDSEVNKEERSLSVTAGHFSVYTILKASSSTTGTSIDKDFGDLHLKCSGAQYEIKTLSNENFRDTVEEKEKYIYDAVLVNVSKLASSGEANITVTMKSGRSKYEGGLIIVGKGGGEIVKLTLDNVTMSTNNEMFPLRLYGMQQAEVTLKKSTLRLIPMSGYENQRGFLTDVSTKLIIGEGTSTFDIAKGSVDTIDIRNGDLTIDKESGKDSKDCILNLQNYKGYEINDPNKKGKMVTINGGKIVMSRYFSGVNVTVNGGMIIETYDGQYESPSGQFKFIINGGTHSFNKRFINFNGSYYLSNYVFFQGGSINVNATQESYGRIVSGGLTRYLYVMDLGSTYKNTKITGVYGAGHTKLSYGTEDCYTDDDGRAYFWLTSSEGPYSVTAGSSNTRFVSKISSSTLLKAYYSEKTVNTLKIYSPAKDLDLDISSILTGDLNANRLKPRTTITAKDGTKYKDAAAEGKISNIFKDIKWTILDYDSNKCKLVAMDNASASTYTGTYETLNGVDLAALVIRQPGIYKLKAELKDGLECSIEKTFTIKNVAPVTGLDCNMKDGMQKTSLSLKAGTTYSIKYNQESTYTSASAIPENTIEFRATPATATNRNIVLKIYRKNGTTEVPALEATVGKSATGNLINAVTFKAPGEYVITASVKDGKAEGSDYPDTPKVYKVTVTSTFKATSSDYKYDGGPFSSNSAKIKVTAGSDDKTATATYRILDISEYSTKNAAGNYVIPGEATAETLPNEYITKLSAETPKQLSGISKVYSPGAYLVWAEYGSFSSHTAFVIEKPDFTFICEAAGNQYAEISNTGKFSDNEARLKAVYNGSDITNNSNTLYSFLNITGQMKSEYRSNFGYYTLPYKTAEPGESDYSDLDLSGFKKGLKLSDCNETPKYGVYAVRCQHAGISMYAIIQVLQRYVYMDTKDFQYSDKTLWESRESWLPEKPMYTGGTEMPSFNSQHYDFVKLDSKYYETDSEGNIKISNDVRRGDLFTKYKVDVETLFDGTTLKPEVTKVEPGAWMVRCTYDPNDGDGAAVGYAAFVVGKMEISGIIDEFKGKTCEFDGKYHESVDLTFKAGYKSEDPNNPYKGLTFTLSGDDKLYADAIPEIRNVGKYSLTVSAKNSNYYKGSAEASVQAEITVRNIRGTYISISQIPNQYFTGEEVTPVPDITDAGIENYKLVEGEDFTLEYSNNVNIGTATVTIKGGRNYSGSAATTFRIVQYSGRVQPLYDGENTIAAWYNGKVTITADGYKICDTATGTYMDSFDITGNEKGVYKDLYFKYVGDTESDKYGAVFSQKLGPFNFSIDEVKKLIHPTYNGVRNINNPYIKKVEIAGEDCLVCETENGTFAKSFILEGNGEGVKKTLYFMYNKDGAYKGAVVPMELGPFNFIDRQDYTKAGVTFKTYSGVYDGAYHPVIVSINNIPFNLKASELQYSLDAGAYEEMPEIKDVGTHNLSVSFDNSECYKGKTDVAPGPKITARSISNARFFTISDLKDEYYTGDSITKKNLTVSDNELNEVLSEGKDFTVRYENNVNTGTARIVITGTGNYKDTLSGTFEIKEFPGELQPLYDGKKSKADWYPGVVTITAEGYLICDSAGGTFTESYDITGNSKGISKTLYFKYVGDPAKPYFNAIVSRTLGPFNFSTATPTGSIKVMDKTWKKLQDKDKTYGYTNEAKKVTITADEKSSAVGMKSIQYLISSKCYTAVNTLSKAEGWEEYQSGSKPGLSENRINYSYAKFTDNAGNVAYISTQGIWYDTNDPKVDTVKSTAADTKVDIEVKGKDNESGIKYYYALINKKGEDKPSKTSVRNSGHKKEDGNISVAGLTASTAYKIYAVIEDKAGNLSEVKETGFTTKESKAADGSGGSGGTSGGGKTGAKTDSGKGKSSSKTSLGPSNSAKRGVGASSNTAGKTGSGEKEDTVIKTKIPYIDDATEGILTGKEKTSGWDNIFIQAGDAEEPAEIHIDMNGATVVPSFVLNTLEGKNVTCYFEMGNDIIWAVNGLSFEGKVKDDIDFRVKTDTKNIPSKLINEIADVYPHKNLTLSHEGRFGFDAIMSLNVGEENEGMYANLYYYNEKEGALEFMDSADVDGNGNTQFEFDHASDYTVILRGDALTEKTAEMIVNNSEPKEGTEVSEVADSRKRSSRHWWLFIITILSLLLCGFIMFMPEKKRAAE